MTTEAKLTKSDVEAAVKAALAEVAASGSTVASTTAGAGTGEAGATSRGTETSARTTSDINSEEAYTVELKGEVAGGIDYLQYKRAYLSSLMATDLRRQVNAATFDKAVDAINLVTIKDGAAGSNRRNNIASTLDMLGMSENPTMQDAIAARVVEKLGDKITT
jgi:hypothetical protein